MPHSQLYSTQSGIPPAQPMVKDLISVVIPTYNHAHFLGDAIRSALEQTYAALSTAMVDDGSTDGSRALVASFGERVRYIWQANRGLSGARNTGIQATRGEYIALLDADDFWEPDYLATVHALLAAEPTLGAVYTGLQFVNSKGESLPQPCVATVGHDQLYDRLLDGEFFAPSAVLIRRSCFTAVGLFDEALRASEDWDMWLRVAHVYPFVGIAQPLLNYRVHGNNMSADPAHMLRYQTLMVCKHFGAPEGDPASWPQDRQRAWAATTYFAAQGYFLRGDQAAGQSYLRQAFEANPALTENRDLFYELGCVDQPLGQRGDPATLNLAKNAATLLTALTAIFADPTLAPRVQTKKGAAFAHANLALGMLAYNSGQRAKARTFWLRALRYAPQLTWQDSLLIKLAKSFVKPEMAITMRHWLGTKKYQLGQSLRGLAYRTATPWGQRVVNNFWEEQAVTIHEQWGSDQHDFPVLSRLFQRYQPKTLLDVGCGSGRLFGLYTEHGINDIVGMDISEKALVLAKERYPWVTTFQGKVEDLEFPAKRFDLAVCNRVLQHIPPRAIEDAIQILCTLSHMVYVNELSASDQLTEEFFMFRHHYPTLFATQQFQLIETGEIGQQTFQLFGAGNEAIR